MNKKIFPVVFLIMLFFAGIIALTQELDFFAPAHNRAVDSSPDWIKPARWFRSNAGGMALEEVQSRLVALRFEYALAIVSARDDELPDFLSAYYERDYRLEIRVLYRNSEQVRTQWLFRDINNVTRLNAVFLHNDDSQIEFENIELIVPQEHEKTYDEDMTEIFDHIDTAEIYENELHEIDDGNEQERTAKIDIYIENKTGFIEIFNEKSVLTAEYRFHENGQKNKTEYEVKDNLLISAIFMNMEGNTAGEYTKIYADFYRYNRSFSLRMIERVFYKDIQADYKQNIINFKGRILDSVNEIFLVTERLNLYPEYFGNVLIHSDSKMIYETDDRGRIIAQTLYDEENNIIWVIRNTWSGDRIVSTNKKEGDSVLLAEFQYNSAGDRILERNYKDGMLERVVRTDGKIDIEELYMDNVLVLRAVWDDGIMVSETRVTD